MRIKVRPWVKNALNRSSGLREGFGQACGPLEGLRRFLVLGEIRTKTL